MGSLEGQDDEQPAHEVWLDSFALAAYPVTREQYARFLDATGHPTPRDGTTLPGTPHTPVVGVSWDDAQAFCQWHNRDGDRLRLPTEAEWEYAGRGGLDGVRYPWGDTIPAWIPNGGRGPLPAPWPVTHGEPNAFGLYGIAANIHEWCADWHAADFYARSPARNPAGPPTGVRRVSRGGSWRHAVTISRSAARSKLDPSFRYSDYGFRVAQSPWVGARASARAGAAQQFLNGGLARGVLQHRPAVTVLGVDVGTRGDE